jgi:hypothetical protein
LSIGNRWLSIAVLAGVTGSQLVRTVITSVLDVTFDMTALCCACSKSVLTYVLQDCLYKQHDCLIIACVKVRKR